MKHIQFLSSDDILKLLRSQRLTKGERAVICWNYHIGTATMRSLIQTMQVVSMEILDGLATGFPSEVAAYKAYVDGSINKRITDILEKEDTINESANKRASCSVRVGVR